MHLQTRFFTAPITLILVLFFSHFFLFSDVSALITEAASVLKFEFDYEDQKIEGYYDRGMTISNEHARNGAYSLRVYLQRGSERTQLRIKDGGEKYEVELGVEHWVGLSYYLPASFVPDLGGGYGDLVFQFKGIPDADEGEAWNLNPIVSLNLMGDQWQIRNRWDSNRVTVKPNYQGQVIQDLGKYSVNRWTDFVFQYLPSYGSDGILKVWKNGVLVFERYGPNCFNDKHGPAIDYGIYKWHWYPWNSGGDDSITERILFIDEVRVATGTNGFNLVNPAGFGGVGPPPAPAPTFSDVPADHWAFDSIESLYRDGYISGCSANPMKFCPENYMTRGEGAVFVERGIWGGDYLPPQPTGVIFADVSLEEWFAKWAHGLWIDGYTAGCGSDPLNFCALEQHTRAEATVFFERMLHGKDFTPSEPVVQVYADVPIGAGQAWFSKWVNAAHADQFIQACEDDANRGDSTFRPSDGITRAEAACMLDIVKSQMTSP